MCNVHYKYFTIFKYLALIAKPQALTILNSGTVQHTIKNKIK